MITIKIQRDDEAYDSEEFVNQSYIMFEGSPSKNRDVK